MLLGIVAALAMSIYWQSTKTKIDLPGFNPQVPNDSRQIPLPVFNLGGSAEIQNARAGFTSADGALTFEYPSSFQDGTKLLGQATQNALKLNNVLFFYYQVSIPDLQPSYILASENNSTSTQEIAEQIRQILIKQQCQIDIAATSPQDGPVAEIIDAAYECPTAQKDLSQWHSQTATVKKENGFYVITAVTTSKNWPNLKLEAQTIFNSIAVKNSKPDIEKTSEQP